MLDWRNPLRIVLSWTFITPRSSEWHVKEAGLISELKTQSLRGISTSAIYEYCSYAERQLLCREKAPILPAVWKYPDFYMQYLHAIFKARKCIHEPCILSGVLDGSNSESRVQGMVTFPIWLKENSSMSGYSYSDWDIRCDIRYHDFSRFADQLYLCAEFNWFESQAVIVNCWYQHCVCRSESFTIGGVGGICWDWRRYFYEALNILHTCTADTPLNQ